MTVSSAGGVFTFKGDGATISWSFPMTMPAVNSPSQAAQYLMVIYVDPNGIPNVVTYGSGLNNYQVAVNSPVPPNPSSVGGILTYKPGGNPIPVGSSITIQRILPVVQQTSLQNQGSLWQPAIESALDYLTMLAQGVVTPVGGAVSSFNGRGGAITLQGTDVAAAGGALLASPALTGVPTAPTPPAGDNSNEIATTAFVAANGGGPGNRKLLLSILPSSFPIQTVNMLWNFTNQYDEYEIDIYDLQTNNNTATATDYGAQLSFDGVTWDASPLYNYVTSGAYSNIPGQAVGGAGTINFLFLGLSPLLVSTPSLLAEYHIKFSMPWTNDRYKLFMVEAMGYAPAEGVFRLSSTTMRGDASGYPSGIQPLKGIRFFDAGGFQTTRGIFNLYGIVKAQSGT